MDEIEALFNDITPEDLQTPTTAVRRTFEERAVDDEEAFIHFLLTYVEATRIAYEVSEGEPSGLIVLANAGELRVFNCRLVEPSEAFIERVAAEAVEMPAAWLFAAVPGAAVIGQTLDLETSSGKKQFSANSIPVVNWYAQAVTLDVIRFGVLNPGDSMRCYVGADLAGAAADFRRILEDVA